MQLSQNAAKIAELIELTEDPAQRATLLVLASLDAGLHENTQATQRIASMFDEHRKLYDEHQRHDREIKAGFKGAYWAGIVFIGFMQLAGGALVGFYIKANDKQDDLIGMNASVIHQLDKRVSRIEVEHERMFGTDRRK